MYVTLPKNSNGRLERRSLRRHAHRFWHVQAELRVADMAMLLFALFQHVAPNELTCLGIVCTGTSCTATFIDSRL